jgi:hypothetical protein
MDFIAILVGNRFRAKAHVFFYCCAPDLKVGFFLLTIVNRPTTGHVEQVLVIVIQHQVQC